MKKIKLLTSIATLTLVLGLGACSSGEEETVTDDTELGQDDVGVSTSDEDDNEGYHVHEYEITDSKDATCLEDGYITYTCKDGDDTYTETIPALGHDWSEWVTTIEPGDTTTGEETRTCSRCGATETNILDATNHVFEYRYDSDYHWQECAVCGLTTEKESHTLTYSASNLEHYHTVSCDCGYSLEDVHQSPSDTNSICLCGKELSTDKFEYTFDSEKGGYLITQWASSMDDPSETELYLPSEHTGDEGTYPVVGIADGQSYESSMRDFYNLEFVAFPDSFTYIGNYAFYNMSWLKEVAFSENSQLEKIGDHCFDGDDESGAGIHTLVLTSENVELGESALANVSSRSNDYFSIVLGPKATIGTKAFYNVYVNFFYRGTSEEKTANGITNGGAEYPNWYYEGEWELVNHVPMVIS